MTTRERWETPDGDFVDVERLRAGREDPTVVLLHGLEGSSRSGYIQETLRLLATRPVNAVALNFRSCSGEQNRLCRAYSSGDWQDVAFVMDRLDGERLTGPRHLVGFSLGGNVALKFLANSGAADRLTSAAAVGVPYDLDACVRALDERRGAYRLYRQWFIRPLRKKALAKAARFPGQLDRRNVADVRTIREFDEHVTAPLFGYASAEDYYARASAGPDLHRIAVPTLLLSSDDDPLAPAAMIPKSAYENPRIHVVRVSGGGHIGFVEQSALRPRYWAEEQVVSFLLSHE